MPTIKPQTFHAGAHHATCTARRQYLERNGRALDRICFNVSDPEHWDRELDSTRAQYHLRGSVTYREYIISPSASDHASVAQVRDLAYRWCEENFPTAEAVIILHNDNKSRVAQGKKGIVHAHVVVNSVDLEAGRKIALDNEKVREVHNSLQRIAATLGLSRMPDYIKGQRLVSAQPRRITQTERRLELRGVRPWKSEVRDMALQALSLSATPQEFKQCLDRADIDLLVSCGRIYLADRDNPTRACRADRLDAALSAQGITRSLNHSQNAPEQIYKTSDVKRDLGKGNQAQLQMQAYDHRCRKALETYHTLVKKSVAADTLNKLPSFQLPKPYTQAEKQRAAQAGHLFFEAAQRLARADSKASETINKNTPPTQFPPNRPRAHGLDR